MRVKEGIRISSKTIKQKGKVNEKQFYQRQLALYKEFIVSHRDQTWVFSSAKWPTLQQIILASVISGLINNKASTTMEARYQIFIEREFFISTSMDIVKDKFQAQHGLVLAMSLKLFKTMRTTTCVFLRCEN
ncbi:uncharacterized protein LOC110065285 [Orbicella faveolata]|uniref:uncharacterized protein LOC110065262 n=1 Tax=Orbicella faveolata TaxID=48498 RepID=UPI0009E57583|nr:uncharacterized protein LOC110065262 [Orbicella faveolata]XP_020628069.1 uncharacterized protein LOC110065285 [Orbicella faveolata]